MYATDFVFDGVNLSSKGYMICTFDGDSIVSGGEIEPIVKKTPSVDEYTYYVAEINNVLTWELGICKLPCGTEAFEPLNQYEESELAQFLLKTDGYRWLQFVQPDDYPDVFYKVYINMTPYQIGGQTFGYNLTITSNCGYGFSHEYTATLTDDNQPLTINVNNDLNRYIYPTVSFETNADECWIYNENDLEQNLDNGKECHFYNLGDNVDILKEINMDSGNDLVQGLENPNQFNFHYLRLVNGENNIYADGILADDHYSTTEWSEVTQYNYHPTKNFIQTGDISHIKSSNGIRTKRIAVEYELSGGEEIVRNGNSNINGTITVPNDNYTTLKTKLKNIAFNMEKAYNYVYLYKLNDYEYKLLCADSIVFYVPVTGAEGEFHSGTYYDQKTFDIYDIIIDNITGELDNSTKSTSMYALEEDDASFLYVPVEIKDYNGAPYIPVTRIFTPEITHERVTDNLFELDGLPIEYQSLSAFTEYIQNRGVIMLRTDDSYEIIDSSSQTFYYYFSHSGKDLKLNIMITPGSGYKIYNYDTLNKTWSKTADTGGTYSQEMKLNGAIGDVVYISDGTIVAPRTNGEHAIANGTNFSNNINKWEICNKGQFIIGGNYASMANYSTTDSVWINKGNASSTNYNEKCLITLTPAPTKIAKSGFFYNHNSSGVTVIWSPNASMQPYTTTTIPSGKAYRTSGAGYMHNLDFSVVELLFCSIDTYSSQPLATPFKFTFEGLPEHFQTEEAYNAWTRAGHHATILKVKTDATQYTTTFNIKYILIQDCTLDIYPQRSNYGSFRGNFYEIRNKDSETPVLYEYNDNLKRWHGSPITGVQDGSDLFKIGSVDSYSIAHYTDIVIDDQSGDIESSIGLDWMNGNDNNNQWELNWYTFDENWNLVLHDRFTANNDDKYQIYPTTLITFPLEDAILNLDNAQITDQITGVTESLYNAEEVVIHTCNITGITGNVLEYSYDKYDPIESQQNATIKYREIRRVLV